MSFEPNTVAVAYLRISRDEALKKESSSIENQRMMIRDYCRERNIKLIKEFVDDGCTGADFNRPGFQDMLVELDKGVANTVIAKDLSRLGRNMSQTWNYIRQYFPEKNIHFFTITDAVDTKNQDSMDAFRAAMNEVYIGECSKKIKAVLENKRKNGQYCACPPFGYKKADGNKGLLIPDEMTAPIVQRIFMAAANGDSSRKIAEVLSNDRVITPLKYRVLHRDKFGDDGAARATDIWNNTTVKRILKNEVYLGKTILGKTSKVSYTSKVKMNVPKEEWVKTENTHEPLVSEDVFRRANENLGKGSNDYRQYEHVRKNIFSGITYCASCGHALCSAGSVYKGEREKYWYLSCTHNRKNVKDRCSGARIFYSDLLDIVINDLNSLISLSDEQANSIIKRIVEEENSDKKIKARKIRKDKLESEILIKENAIAKLYTDYSKGIINDGLLLTTVEKIQRDMEGYKKELDSLANDVVDTSKSDNYKMFFELVKRYTNIEKLDREAVLTFIDRIEIGPKIFPQGKQKATHKNTEYEQSIRIFYKFIGEIDSLDISA